MSDLLRNSPEFRRRTRIRQTTHLPGSTPLSPLTLSDSEPDLDFDQDSPPLFEPLFSAFPDEQHHQHDVSFVNNFSHRSSTCPDVGPYFGSGWVNYPAQSCGLYESGERFNCQSSDVNLELGLGLGLGLGMSSSQANFDQTRRFDGLRPVNLDSDSDSDSDSEDVIFHDYDYNINNVNNNNNNNNNNNTNNNNLGFGGVSDFDRPPFCWDYLGFNNNRNHDVQDASHDINVEIEGENNDDYFVYNGDDDEDDEAYAMVRSSDDVDVDAGVSILFDAYQEREEQREIVIESDGDEVGEDLGVEDAIRDLEWEILMAVNNFNREVYDLDFNVDMYEAILGEVEERMNEWRGCPPASETVIENLPTVKFANNDGVLKENEVICAICREEVLGEEEVRQLPCLHYYHGECILPWLKIRNTCPVCRYELPTDDVEYECRKRERQGGNANANANVINDELTLDSQVSSYDFHVFL